MFGLHSAVGFVGNFGTAYVFCLRPLRVSLSHHGVIVSSHHRVISSSHHLIISSSHHLIISSSHHPIIPSSHHLIVISSSHHRKRLKYGVVGEVVDVASRVNAMNRINHTTFLISESTWEAVHGRYLRKYVGTVPVKSGTQSDNVYVVTGRTSWNPKLNLAEIRAPSDFVEVVEQRTRKLGTSDGVRYLLAFLSLAGVTAWGVGLVVRGDGAMKTLNPDCAVAGGGDYPAGARRDLRHLGCDPGRSLQAVQVGAEAARRCLASPPHELGQLDERSRAGCRVGLVVQPSAHQPRARHAAGQHEQQREHLAAAVLGGRARGADPHGRPDAADATRHRAPHVDGRPAG
eukprot:3939021-Rhodomonas_salina.1